MFTRWQVRSRLFRVCGLRHPWLATILPSMNPRRFAVLLFGATLHDTEEEP